MSFCSYLSLCSGIFLEKHTPHSGWPVAGLRMYPRTFEYEVMTAQMSHSERPARNLRLTD
jgi:hypothetical protein